MGSFNAITFNCNGLGNKSKRLKVFTYLRDKLKNGVGFLQETHSVGNLEKKWKSQWGGDIYFSHGTSNSTGCAIAFSKDFPIKILNQSKDDNGVRCIPDGEECERCGDTRSGSFFGCTMKELKGYRQ